MKPAVHQFRLYGPENSLVVDDDYQVLLKMPGKNYLSYLRYLQSLVDFGGQYARNAGLNIRQFARRQFHLPYDSGMKTLLEAFYACVAEDTAPPFPYPGDPAYLPDHGRLLLRPGEGGRPRWAERRRPTAEIVR